MIDGDIPAPEVRTMADLLEAETRYRFAVDEPPSRLLYAGIARLFGQFFPDHAPLSYERFWEVAADPRTHVACLYATPPDGDEALVGMMVLPTVRTLSRTAVLIEEFVIDEAYRGRGLGKLFDDFLLAWVRDHTDATRVEGTVNEANPRVWHVHMTSGFFDRKNKTILAVIRRDDPPA